MLNANEQGEIELLKNDRVIIRVWTSGVNQSIPGEGFGHISLQIPSLNLYMSLWPYQGGQWNNETKTYEYHEESALANASLKEYLLNGIQAEDIETFTLEKDIGLEGDDPKLTLCLYTLDIYKIQAHFQELTKEHGTQKWGLLGFRDAHSCASAVRALLLAGGITQLVSKIKAASLASAAGVQGFFGSSGENSSPSDASAFSSEMSVASIIASPDAFSIILPEAKKAELKKHPLTKHISFEGETEIAVPEAKNEQPANQKGSKSLNCSIM